MPAITIKTVNFEQQVPGTHPEMSQALGNRLGHPSSKNYKGDPVLLIAIYEKLK